MGEGHVGRYCLRRMRTCGEPPHMCHMGVEISGADRPGGARSGSRPAYLLGAVRIAMWLAPAFFAVDMMSTAAPSRTLLSPRMRRVSEPTSASAFRISDSRLVASEIRKARSEEH